MFCPKCGDKVEQNEFYCNKCGNYLSNANFNNHAQNKFNNKKMVLTGLGVGLGVLFLLFITIFTINFTINASKANYYFSDNNYENKDEINQNNNTTSYSSSNKKKSKYSTIVITDNTYSGVQISKKQDAYDLIVKDSVSQKNACSAEIQAIENDIIEKYGITAVNLCEMDLDFAKEIDNVFKKIYDEYPSVRGYLTNLSLINAPLSNGYIAAFMPIFNFATSDTASTYPWVMKTQVLLNTTYFLNVTRLEASVTDGSNSGHFPPNATIYSPVAHELGHYLSFLAMMKYYEMNSILLIDESNVSELYDLYDDFCSGDYSLDMIKEAYENCKRDTNTSLEFDEWRATISSYAVARDNNGDYIYDETIAEGFHDVYLNGENAKEASKCVVSVLKERLEG